MEEYKRELEYYQKMALTRVHLESPAGELINVSLEQLCIIAKYGGRYSELNDWIHGPVRLTVTTS